MTDVADVLVHQDQAEEDEILTQVPESPDMLADEIDPSEESESAAEASEDVEAAVGDIAQTGGELSSVPDEGHNTAASQHSLSRRTSDEDQTDSVQPSTLMSQSELPAQPVQGKKADSFMMFLYVFVCL